MTAAPRDIAAIASPRSARSRRAASEVPPASATAAASTSGASPGSPTTPVLTTTARWPRATMMSRTSRDSSDLVSRAANSAILCPAELVAFMALRSSFRGRLSPGGAVQHTARGRIAQARAIERERLPPPRPSPTGRGWIYRPNHALRVAQRQRYRAGGGPRGPSRSKSACRRGSSGGGGRSGFRR